MAIKKSKNQFQKCPKNHSGCVENTKAKREMPLNASEQESLGSFYINKILSGESVVGIRVYL